MIQTRLYFPIAEPEASRMFARLEAEFEPDGWPLAMAELDEATTLQEISIYVQGDVKPAEHRILRHLVEIAERPVISVEAVPDIDWVAHSLQGLEPVRAGRFLVYGRHDRHRLRSHEIGIEIDAGQAFGTGHHGTTSGCLETLESVIRRERPRNMLDLGTGSAVLAVGAAKMAKIPVLATDIDPVAIAVAARNLRLNGVAGYVRPFVATGFGHREVANSAPFDLIVANILARPLMSMAPQMARHLTPGGSVILSGILASQRNAVMSSYRNQKFRHIRTIFRNGWVTLHLKR